MGRYHRGNFCRLFHRTIQDSDSSHPLPQDPSFAAAGNMNQYGNPMRTEWVRDRPRAAFAAFQLNDPSCGESFKTSMSMYEDVYTQILNSDTPNHFPTASSTMCDYSIGILYTPYATLISNRDASLTIVYICASNCEVNRGL